MPAHGVPVQPLSARLSGLPLDVTLYEGTPPHLLAPLSAWARNFLTEELAYRIAARLRFPLSPHSTSSLTSAPGELVARTGTELLDVIDVALQLDASLDFEIYEVGTEEGPDGPYWPSSSHRARAVERLDELLDDGGSAYTVSWVVPMRLMRRVDPSVTAAAEHVMAIADATVAELLADAWRLVYGRPPDPTTAYRQAVRAVEQVACPLVLPNAPKTATLGKVRDHLRDAPHKWTFTLVDGAGDGTVEPVAKMFDRMWTGQVSRHGGSRNRDQTQTEAEAAVHLAVVLIQWLTSGALRRLP